MSQFYQGVTSGSLPPVVATSYVTDDGTAIPAANILNVNGVDSTENNNNGILTRANPDLSDNLEIVITNRLKGTGSTSGAATVDLVTFSLGATPSSFVVDANICAFNASTPAGAGYSLFGTVRTDGVTASIVQTPDKISNEDAALTGCTADISVSGNNLIISGTGVLGLNINWAVVANYVQVS